MGSTREFIWPRGYEFLGYLLQKLQFGRASQNAFLESCERSNKICFGRTASSVSSNNWRAGARIAREVLSDEQEARIAR
jgi:hypothetical protein